MKALLFFAALAAAAGFFYLQTQSRDEAPTGEAPAAAETAPATADAPPQPAAPGVTPHPAKEATAEAVRLYPALADRNSPMNTAFVALYNQKKTTDPALLSRPDWPLTLADRVATTLGVKPAK